MVLVWNNGSLSFWDQDESAYAGFAYNMIQNNDFVTPIFTWGEPHRKTPFHFWSIALSYKIFGINEFAVRFPSLVSVLFTAFLVFYLGKRVFGKEVSLAGALILLSSILLPSLGKIAVTDALLLVFETLAILSLFNFIKHPSFMFSVLFCLGLAGGMLVKGPPVLMMSGLAGFLLLIFHPNRLRLLNYKLILAAIISFAPILIWGRLSWLKDDGNFILFLLDHYIINRAKGGTFANQTGPPGYYLVIFMLSFIFWLPFLFGGLKDMFVNAYRFFAKKVSFSLVETDIILLCWCVAGWLFYEPIKSKLPAYAIGAYPAIALLIATYALKITDKPLDKWFKFFSYFQMVLTVLIALALGIAMFFLLNAESLPVTIGIGIGVVFVGVTILAFIKFFNSNFTAGFKLIFLNAFLFLFLGWSFLVPLLEPNRSISKRATALIDENLSKTGLVVFSKNFYLPSFPFYVLQTGRTYTAIDPTNEDLLAQFRSQTKVAIVFDQEKWELFQKLLDPKIDHPKVKEINGWALDMAKKSKFTIVFN